MKPLSAGETANVKNSADFASFQTVHNPDADIKVKVMVLTLDGNSEHIAHDER